MWEIRNLGDTRSRLSSSKTKSGLIEGENQPED